jgi:hypothetical protein
MITSRFAIGRIVAVAPAAVAVAGLALATASAQPAPKKFAAVLNVGQEMGVAKGTSRGASGTFSAGLTVTHLTWKLTFKGLSGAATAAHIHGPAARGQSAGVLVPLCGPCTSPATGSVTLKASVVKDLLAGKAYVNVHTAKNPNGEIRGQITRR